MSGQSLTEFLAGLSIIAILLGGSVTLFQTAWQRTYCAKRAFETAHHARIALSQGGSLSGESSATSRGVRTELHCGSMKEVVELPLLEKAQW
jgi:hypothetical protein